MIKFLGTWLFQPQAQCQDPMAIKATDSLSLQFTEAPFEATTATGKEYRTGHAFPVPSDYEFVDPARHTGVYEWIRFSSQAGVIPLPISPGSAGFLGNAQAAHA